MYTYKKSISISLLQLVFISFLLFVGYTDVASLRVVWNKQSVINNKDRISLLKLSTHVKNIIERFLTNKIYPNIPSGHIIEFRDLKGKTRKQYFLRIK